VRLGRYEVDFLWREEGLVAEVAGFAFHADRTTFESDRRRDAELAGRGLTVIRVTWRQIVDEPEALLAMIAQALAVVR
jgi:very-short-patch-repair endonuclease